MSTFETIPAVDPTDGQSTICIVGLGYVGLPLAVAFDGAKFDTIGYDIDSDRIQAFTHGHDPTDEVGDKQVQESTIEFTAQPQTLSRADFILVTVPTPLDTVQAPKLEFVESAARTIGQHITPGTTVVLESTVYPGVTRDIFGAIIEAESGLESGTDFHLGYSPERLSPGSNGIGLRDAVKIVSADTEQTRARLATLYEQIVDAGVYAAPTIETAEAAKVLENVQRDLNIALMNEMAIICDHLGLDTQEVIEACSTKWNFHDYSPGLVGGHCIPVDPFYLVHGSERAGFSPRLILQAREINEYMPTHVAELTVKALNQAGKVLKDSRILILGLSYKPNIADTRTSEVPNVVNALSEYDIEVAAYDPIAEPSAEAGCERLESLQFEGFDGILLSTPHDAFHEIDFEAATEALAPNPVLIDVKGQLDGEQLERAGYTYRRL